MNDCYVYTLLDHRKPGRFTTDICSFLYEPFYLGKANTTSDKKNKNKRYRKHINEAKCGKLSYWVFNMKKFYRIREIISRTGEEPIVLIVQENMLEEDSYELEKKMIRELGRIDNDNGPLVNRTNGGGAMRK